MNTNPGIFGKKVGMTQYFRPDGSVARCTVINTAAVVVGKRTLERDGYSALVLGFGDAKEKHLTKAQAGSFKKAGAKAKRIVREFRVDASELASFNVGEGVKVDALFKKGDLVDVTGITKGRGYQGVVKRWNFRGFGQTHGTHEYRKHPGAIGQRKTPGRVYPNKKLPGHYGVEQVTTQNLEVVAVYPEKNLILVKGGIAGPNDGLVTVKPSVKLAMRAAHKAAKGGKK